ncbi:MAG: PTS sugar transporter subunit IIA [Mycoplasmatales bacterium]
MDNNLFKKEFSFFPKTQINRQAALSELASRFQMAGKITDETEFINDVLAREALSSTAFGNGIAIPHGRTTNVLEPVVGFVKFPKPVIWDQSNQEVSVMILIAVPESDQANTHLKILSTLARKLMHEEFRAALLVSDEHTIETTINKYFEEWKWN